MSPFQKKDRNCRLLDKQRGFKPMGVPGKYLDKVVVFLDEFEAMRLVDLEGKSQIEAGELMYISRGTVQRLLTTGRAKLIDAMLNNKIMIINETDEESENE